MDSNINENVNDKINQDIEIKNSEKNDNNELKISQNEKNYELLEKMGNFNIDENEDEDEDEEEKNDAYIQELMKQGKYSDVIKFLESNDKKSKMNKKNDGIEKKNGENDENSDFNEDEELEILPADDISDLHEDNNDFNTEEKEEKNVDADGNYVKINTNNNNIENVNFIGDKNKKFDIYSKDKKGGENQEEENNKMVNNKSEDKDKIVNKINTENINDNSLNNDNINKEGNIENNLKTNFVKNKKDDISYNNVNGNKNYIEKEIPISKVNNTNDANNNHNINNEINGQPIELNNNIKTQDNPNKDEIDIINNEQNIKPKDIIKNIISNNNSEYKNQKIKKKESSNSLNSSSLLHLSFEEEEENNKYYEERLKDIKEQRKVIKEQNSPGQNIAMNNLELLTKELEELNELENNENEDLNGIEQMNEMYVMVQEDKQSSLLQEKVREKLFPFYNKAIFDMKDIIKNDYFKSINNNRNFFISNKILDDKTISKKKNNILFNINYPKSIFDNLKFDKSDIKNGLDYDEYLDEFLEEKNNFKKTNSNKTKEKIIKNNNSKIEKLFLKYKNNIKNKKCTNEKKMNNIKPIKIFINNKKEQKNNSINDNNSKLKEQYDINIDEIFNKYQEKINTSEEKIDLKKYNQFFVDNFNKKNEIFNFNDYSIDLDLDDDIKKELTNNKTNANNIEDKDKENYYLKINGNTAFDEKILNNYSLLRFINLENNNLTKFPDFSKCPMIYSINMNNNKITKIDKISSLKYLEKLSLTNNSISSIENCSFNKKLRFLFLGHNKISNIDNISIEVPFIEEIILCQNNITYLPNKIYLPYLKFFDLNENKISFNSSTQKFLYFICPSLEKLLLLGNNLNEDGTHYLIKYCPRLKEIDLSFNKYNDIIELVKLLSINSNWNSNLEMINVVGNTFFNSNKNKELFYLLIKRFCPSIKFINNEEIKKNKPNIIINFNSPAYNNYSKINCNLNESYINIYNSQNSFMKYFTSVYFTNKIFNIYNININNNLKTSNAELFILINQAYFQFKLSHFISQTNINKSNIGFFAYESNFHFDDLLIYLYKFKNRMIYITHSIPILVKRTWFRRTKIIKIQQQYKLRILRKKLAAIVIPDDEDDHAEDLLEFFNSGEKKENGINEDEKKVDIDLDLDKKMKEIELNIEKNMKNKKSKSKSNFQFLEVIKEEDKDIKDQDIQIGIKEQEKKENKKNSNKNIDLKKNIENDNKVNETDNNNINKKLLNNNTRNNNHFINSNKIEISATNEIHNEKNKEKEKEKDSLVMRLLSNPKYNNGNNKLNPIRLTPIIKNPNNIQSSNNIINKNNIYYNNNFNNNYNNNQNIDMLKRGLGVAPNNNSGKILNFFNDDNIKTRYPTKIILKDDKNYGKLYDINAQSNLPKNSPPTPGLISGKKGGKYNAIKRPESNGVFLPKINNNLNVSTTTLSNETNSAYSHLTTGKKFLKISHNQGKPNIRKPDEVLLLEQECREAIEKAKSEWKFTNKEVEAILVNKIRKKYNKKINALLHKH